MERFTEKFKDGRNILRKGISDIFHVGFGRFFSGEAIDKLAEYEDLEEQGKLLNLPCKPHDKLYWISDQDEDAEFSYEPIEEVEVCNIDYNGYSLQLWFADKGAKEFPVLEVSSIEKELFYTREDAEAALKELEGKNGNASKNT